MFGYSRIYGYVSLVIASIITIILLCYFIHIGLILDFSTSAPLCALLVLVVVYFFVYFIAYMQSFSILSKKYEYTFEDYKYSIKKEVLEYLDSLGKPKKTKKNIDLLKMFIYIIQQKMKQKRRQKTIRTIGSKF